MKALRLCLPLLIAANALPQTFHTNPDKWKEPRVFHQAPDRSFRERVKVVRERPDAVRPDRVESPNHAYWFGDGFPECAGPATTALPNRVITVFTERPWVLRLILSEADCRYRGEVRWISEKLLFVRVWWGRVVGSDLVLDVESEKLIYHEVLYDGALAFQQWQQRKAR